MVLVSTWILPILYYRLLIVAIPANYLDVLQFISAPQRAGNDMVYGGIVAVRAEADLKMHAHVAGLAYIAELATPCLAHHLLEGGEMDVALVLPYGKLGDLTCAVHVASRRKPVSRRRF